MITLNQLIKNNKNIVLELDEDKVIKIEGDLILTEPIIVDGNGATVEGNGENRIIICGSDITFKNINFTDFFNVFEINGMGSEIRNIEIENCNFSKYRRNAIFVASTKSHSAIKHLEITDCYFKGPGLTKYDDECFGVYGVMLQCVCATDHDDVTDCTVEDVRIAHCKSDSFNRCAVWIACGCSTNLPHGLEKDYYGHTSDLLMKDVIIEDNDFHDSWDATINVITAMANQDDTLLENLTIRNNIVEQGIWGIFVIVGEPLIDRTNNIRVKNVVISDNTIYLRKGGAGEASYGIAVMAGRLDYFPGSGCDNCSTENVIITRNNIRDVTCGMIITCTDSLVDGPDCTLTNCRLENVEIMDNHIHNVEKAFQFLGTWMEGRSFDYNIGVPLRNKRWCEFINNHKTVTVQAENNVLKHVICRNNHIDGYRYQYFIAGAYAHGHCRIKNNRVEDLTLENNEFTTGEYHCNIQNVIADDWVKDEGNYCDEKVKWSI